MHTIFNTVYAILDMKKYINSKIFENYIWELKLSKPDEQTGITTERQTNQMHKHFSTLLKYVENGKKKYCF